MKVRTPTQVYQKFVLVHPKKKLSCLTYEIPKGHKIKRNASNGKLENSHYSHCLTFKLLIKWINTVIDNTYIALGTDLIFEQSEGLPMGVPPAVWFAQIFMFDNEYTFMYQLLKFKRYDIVREFRFTSRYVDDILALANEYIKHLLSQATKYQNLRGIYPDYLNLTTEQESSEEIHHLDLTIYRHGESFQTKVYDKKLHPPLDQIKHICYPHYESFISRAAKYGVVTSQLVRYARVCSLKESFIDITVWLLKILLTKGYQRKKLERDLTNFIHRHPYLYGVRDKKQLINAITRRIV